MLRGPLARLGWILPVFLAISPVAAPRITANDNRVAAGTLSAGTLTVELVVELGDWYPEAATGQHLTVAAFA